MLTERERHFAESVIDMSDYVVSPMLIYEGEKEVVKKALERLLSEDESERRGK